MKEVTNTVETNQQLPEIFEQSMAFEDSDIFQMMNQKYELEKYDLGLNKKEQKITTFNIYFKVNGQKLRKEFRMNFVTQAKPIHSDENLSAYLLNGIVITYYKDSQKWSV